MYNRELKERYIVTRTGSIISQCKNLFVSSSEQEEKLGKDIAEFTVEEFACFMESLGFAEPNVVRSRQTLVAPYADWYIQEVGLAGHHIRDYDLFSFPYAKLFKPTLITSPEELISKIRQVYDFDSGQPAIAALCIAWVGIDSSDMLKLKKEQVDTRAGKIYDATGGIIVNQIPDIIREVLDIYSKTYSAIRTQNQTFNVYADDRGFFLKRMITANSAKAGKPITTTQVANWICELRNKYAEMFGEETAIPLTYTNVQRSGNFYRLHQMAKSGVDVRSPKNADKVRLCLGQSKRYHKDNMVMYRAYLECIGEGIEN